MKEDIKNIKIKIARSQKEIEKKSTELFELKKILFEESYLPKLKEKFETKYFIYDEDNDMNRYYKVIEVDDNGAIHCVSFQKDVLLLTTKCNIRDTIDTHEYTTGIKEITKSEYDRAFNNIVTELYRVF